MTLNHYNSIAHLMVANPEIFEFLKTGRIVMNDDGITMFSNALSGNHRIVSNFDIYRAKYAILNGIKSV